MKIPTMTRRRFFQALAASALAAGVPLPIGMPVEAATRVRAFVNPNWYLTGADGWFFLGLDGKTVWKMG